VKYLLDTQCWLWLQVRPERLGSELLAALESPANELFLSVASSWEIAIKFALGKLPLPEAPSRYVPSRMEASGSRGLAIDHSHALAVAELPPHHRDPFDRLLIVQSRLEAMTFVTADRALLVYDAAIQLIG
jgi:PIN domain nuclease of toxin-antitoxin system